MKLHAFSLALDAMPFIACHLPVFNTLGIDWHWTIAEGAAMNALDTAWCQPQQPRLSRDGTTEYLDSIRSHPRVTVIQRQRWNGKTEMCNACLEMIKEPCVLMQMDADELWDRQSLLAVCNLLWASKSPMRFRCRYFVGQNLVITSNGTYGNRPGEWVRAWWFKPGDVFLKHEPPILKQAVSAKWGDTDHGITFDHYAYVTESQVRFKEQFYGYQNAVQHWRRLQAHTKFPALLKDFLPWVKDNAIVDRVYQ